MPDVTPKTESGRALLADPYFMDPFGLPTVRDAILAIEREAASAAVAEVLDRLENRVRANYGTLPTGDRVCALIASERGT